MLQIAEIREHKDAFAKALQKRNLDALPLLEKAIAADETRRSTQAKLDDTLAQSNAISKEIGNLYKSGKASEANELKQKTTALKEESKQLRSFLPVL